MKNLNFIKKKVFNKITSVILATIICSAIVVNQNSFADAQSDLLSQVSNAASVAASVTRYTRRFDQWSYKSTDNELYEAGCGLFSTGNAIYAMTGQTINIAELKKWAKSVNGWTASAGLYRHAYFSNLKNSTFAKQYGFTVTGPTDGGITSNNKIIATQLQKGNVAVVIGVPGHYMTITDYDETSNKYFVIEGAVSGSAYRGLEATGWVSESKLSTGATQVKSYTFLTFNNIVPIKYESMPSETILVKNKSTGTYMTVDEGKAANKQNISVAPKQTSNAFKFKLSGGTANYLASMLNTSFILNPLSDTPDNGTNVTLYAKDSSDITQIWKFEAVSGGYIIHSGYNESCVLDVDGTNVLLKTKTGASSQIWILENAVPSLSSITVENAGRTDYYIGETLDTGMRITANYEDGSTKDITEIAEVLYDFSTSGTKNVTFSYTEENVTKTTQLAVTVKEIPTGFFSGSGTQNDPFLIQNKAELEKMRDLVNNTAFNPVYGRAYYLQTADIDLENENWIPIGLGFDGEDGQGAYNYKTRMFYGVYDGGEHYIRNLNVDGSWVNAGLFGAIREDTCEVRNIVVTGQVKTSGMNAGGITGQQQYSALIENCAFIGDVSANEMTGGITGYLYNGTSRENSFCVSNCYHIGSVTSNKYAGGLVGRILFNQYGGNEFYALIENSYHAKGKVSGGTTAGAICSEIVRNDNVTCKANIVNCFAGTDCAANIGVKDATVDTSMLKSNSDMKKLAADMGEPFADHSDSQLCDGYTVFAWQVDRSIGDINADGEVNVADVILLQKWILAIPDTHLANWKAADLYEDNQLNVFDLCLLKRKLLEK